MNYEENPFFTLSYLYHEVVESKLGKVRGFTSPEIILVRIGMLLSGEYRNGIYYFEAKGKRIALNDTKEFILLTRKEYPMIHEYITSITEASVVYDIGAFHGFHTVVGSIGRKVFSFEPDPKNVEELSKQIELNGGIELIERPVWNTEEEVKIDSKGAGSRINSEGIEKSSITIDKFVVDQGNQAPDVIKIDVEGAEYMVLKGAEKY
jgi:FkbM family methyltransferase